MSALLDVVSLSKSFGGLQAVQNISFTLNRGEVLGLLGPNGSGKTTVMNLISGNLRPDAGQVTLAGIALAGLPPHRISRAGIARTFQLVRVVADMRVVENVIAGLAFRGKPLWGAAADAEARALLDRVGLAGRADLLAGELTYIDQKRLELARALALQPQVLLLDEWLAGLNETELRTGITLIRSLQNQGLGIIMVEHVMDAIHALCDRCLIMNTGARIAEGKPGEVLRDPAVIRAYLGDDEDA